MSDGLLSDADLGIGGAASSGGDKLLSDADVGVAGPKYTVAGKDMGGAGKYVAAPFVGFNKGVADALGTPVDLINAGLRAVGVPVSDKPFLGSESIKRGMGLVGANPDEAPAPQNGAEKLLRAAGTGVGQAVGLEMAGAPIARGIAGLAPRTAETIEALTGGGKSVAGTGINATIGAGGSMGSEAAQEAMPESWRTAAGLAGGLAGGFGAAGVAMAPRAVGAGVAAAKKYMMPKTNPEQYAADTLAGFLSDPAAVRAALDLGSGELVPGSKPTLGQLTGDMGALSAEREAATRHPEDFAVRRGEQNAARLDSLEGLQRDGNPADVSNLLRRRMTEFDALAAAHENATATQAQGATNAALGAPRTPEDMGASIRDAVAAGRAQAKDEERALWRAVDPDGTLALPVGPLKSAADRIQSNVSSLARPMEGEERAIFSDVGNAPEVVPFSDLTALRSRVSTAMREELRSAGQTPTYARLSQLRGSIEDAISNAAAHRAASDAAAVQSGEMTAEQALGARIRTAINESRGGEGTGPDFGARTGTTGSVGEAGRAGAGREEGAGVGGLGNGAGGEGLSQRVAGNRVYHPAGSFDVKYEVVDLPSLVTSHDTNFRLNPNYPQNIQPRARETAPAQDQVNGMAARMQPERLGPSTEANSGAPIIGPDNVVESGNGRTLAIAKAYQQGRGGDYRNWLESQGYDTRGMNAPVLVGRRVTPMTDLEREQFAHAANTSSGLRMNAAEQAAADARLISRETIGRIGDASITSPENRGFVRSFLEQIPAAERGGMMDANGNLSQAGVRRIEAAIAARAYGDGEFIARAFDAADPNIKNLSGAMVDAAGPWMKMREAAREGLIDPGHDVTGDVMNAARAVMRARDAGRPVAEMLHQGDMFGGEASGLAKRLILNADGSVASRQQIAENMRTYAEEAQKNLAGPQLFGDSVSPREVLRGSLNKSLGEEAAPVAAALRPEHPAVNMDEGMGDRLRAASDATKERARTFDQGAVGDVLRTRGAANDFRLPDSAVVSKAFTPGPRGFETAQAFRKAAGDDESATRAMADYAAYLVRKNAVDPATGLINPGRLANFQRQYADALRAFPEVARRFSSASSAGEAVAEVMAQRRVALDTYQSGTIGKLLGVTEPSEVTAKIGQIFGQSDAMAQMKRLASEARHDPNAMDGLRKSIADFIRGRFMSNTEVGASGLTGLKSDQFQTFVRKNAGVLGQVFSPDEVANLGAIAADLQRSQRTLNATRLPGQSNTAQDWYKTQAKLAETHQSSLFSKLWKAGLAGGELGVTGAISSMVSTVGAHVAQSMRAAGLKNVDDIVREALLNPEFAKALLMKQSPAQIKNASQSPLAHIIARTIAYPELRRDDRAQRASGGRIQKRDYPAKRASLIEREAERVKKALGGELRPLMNEPDHIVASALRIANRDRG